MGDGVNSTPAGISSKPKPKHAAFEPLALVLLSLATIATAWCSYQAATWSGVSQRTMNLSAGASRRALTAELHAYQMAQLDVVLFSEYVNARASSNEVLARFYEDRFRGEAKTAFNAWMAMNPLKNSNAPAHPFVTNLYRPKLLVDAAAAEDESQKLWSQAGEAGRTGRSYVLVTVLLASALFCSGTASKFEAAWIHKVVLGLGVAILLFAAVRLLMLPVRF